MTATALSERLRERGQLHLLQWWDHLSPPEQQAFAAELEAIDWRLFDQIAALDAGRATAGHDDSPVARARRARPPGQLVRLPRSDDDRLRYAGARQLGLQALADGRVGVILVAGGQGTRLNFPYPKGMYPIGPISGKSLFQILVEQALARSRQAGAAIAYYVMTSDATHAETVAFFHENDHFGFNPDDVRFFVQGNLPAVDQKTGLLLLSDKGRLSSSPDGHGGVVAALARSGCLDDMCRRGVEYLYYHQVDNPLARVCDPVFLGLHLQAGAEVSTKVVAKTAAEEKVGLVVEIDGRPQIIEYSDLPADIARQRDDHGELRLWAGNTAIHLFNRSFIDRVVQSQVELPLHRALKKVPCLDDSGRPADPAVENAFKFERFVFDLLPLARSTLVVETDRQGEFHPLKNQDGEFSPEGVRQAMSRAYYAWFCDAGVARPPDGPVEISPLVALDAAELAAKIDPLCVYDGPLYLSP